MECDKFFEAMSKLIGEQDFEDDMTSTYQFEISKGNQTSVWCIDPTNKKIIKGGIDEPTCTFTLSDEDFIKLMNKEVQAAELFMGGRLKLDGDMGEAMKFQSVMEGFDSDEARQKL
eukprot:CAMPEP_0197019596 /NCGR_PEP_ID=MMETSP1384-20130603/87_1 /TAXON_ID=29189 /ORGANISM="Ammonia sp." /LENGTH=115 /DNA_ID=CAMNT_0042447037 /DNA_START=85 /DNA_END=428 /DNA_ORIENTATION=+